MTAGRTAGSGGQHAGPPAVRIILRPVAAPLPLGLLGLAGGTVALTAQQLGWVPAAQSHQVAVSVLLVAVPLQLVGSVVGFLARDPVAATGMGTLGASWATIGVLTLLGAPGSRSPVLGVMLLYLAGGVLVSATIAAAGKGLVAVVFGLAAVRFALTGVHEYAGGTGWKVAAGWLGLVLGVLALYAALATELESMRQRTVLPTLRHGAARAAIDGEPDAAIGRVDREAGVREEL